MKNKKLKLTDLKVKSFVTELPKDEEKNILGGTGTTTGTVAINCPLPQDGGATHQGPNNCISYPPSCVG